MIDGRAGIRARYGKSMSLPFVSLAPLRRRLGRILLGAHRPLEALRLCGTDPATLARVGLYPRALDVPANTDDERARHGRAVAFASLGRLDEARRIAAIDGERWARGERRRFALALAPFAPGEAADLLAAIAPLAAAGCALAAGDPERAERLARQAPSSAEATALATALAARQGRWGEARRALNDLFRCFAMGPVLAEGQEAAFGYFDLGAAAPIREGSADGPRVSVLMPARNIERHVGLAVRSIRAQTLTAWELIVVDDASDDRTLERAHAAGAGDARVRILRHAAPRGAYAARNTALAKASGRYTTVLDGDDWAHPDRLARQLAAVESGRSAAVLSSLVRMTEDGIVTAPRVFPLIRMNVSSLLVPTEIFAAIGPFDEARAGGDMAMIWRITARYGARRVRRMREVHTIASSRDDSLTMAAELRITAPAGAACRAALLDAALSDILGWRRRAAPAGSPR